MKDVTAEKLASTPSPATKDNAKVRVGAMSPTFPPARDRPANVADSGRLRMGAMSPTFPPVRTR